MCEQDSIVKASLVTFLKDHQADEAISGIDEIVLSYVVSILEDVDTGDAFDEAFDVEEFSEMMDAYLPGFAQITSNNVHKWMFSMANKLHTIDGSKSDATLSTMNGVLSSLSFTPPSDCLLDSVLRGSKRTLSSSSDKEVSLINVTPDPHPQQDSRLCEDTELVVQLSEMFPTACTLELEHCLCLAGRDIEQAAHLVLHRQETGDAIKPQPKAHGSKNASYDDPNDKKLRAIIINKYSYVDADDAGKEHKPHLKKTDPKKLVRYLDSKVVSTKGERFTEIKRQEEEEARNKATLSIKPNKHNRFH